MVAGTSDVTHVLADVGGFIGYEHRSEGEAHCDLGRRRLSTAGNKGLCAARGIPKRSSARWPPHELRLIRTEAPRGGAYAVRVEWAVLVGCWAKASRAMADETNLFLFRFGLCIVALLFLSVGCCFLHRYCVRRSKKTLVCTCGLGRSLPYVPPMQAVAEGGACEMIPVGSEAPPPPPARASLAAAPALRMPLAHHYPLVL